MTRACRVLPLALLLLVTAGLAPAAAQLQFAAAAPTNLQASYAMSNTVDASGNGRTATFTNTTLTPGKYADAQRFNGTSSRMTIPTFNIGNAFTLEAWVLLTQNTRSAIAAPRDGGPTGWQAIIYKGSDDFFLAETGGFFSAGFLPAGANAKLTQVVTPTQLAAGGFHHVATTYDGARVVLLVDGVVMASGAATGAVANSTQPIEIGGSAVDGGYLGGVIDDVRIYSRALSTSEILADMATPVDSPREPVVSWDMEVFAKGLSPAEGGQPVAQGNFPKSTALCDLAPLPAPVGTVTNPDKARLADPDKAGRECELVIQTLVNKLPAGVGYTATLRAKGATTTSDRSPSSNAFDRVAEAVPPLTPGTPRVR